MVGTGNYEGWMGVLRGQGNETKKLAAQALTRNRQLYGMTDLRNDKSHFTKFGGTDAIDTKDSDPWQLSDGEVYNTYTAPTATEAGVWSCSVWRLASLATAQIRFKFLPGITYSGWAGHRYYGAGTSSTDKASQSGDSETITFMFDGASVSAFGLASLSVGIAMALF